MLTLSGTSAAAQAAAPDAGTHRIEIHAKRFSFTPAEITVVKGEPVTLALTSEDVTHSLFVPGLHINQTITKGHVAEVTFTPEAAGDFPGRCGRFCGSGHGSMTFVIHVTDK
ncbi:cupredoxin domain-containing protein [Acidipila sp. 4G-K13]|uniref:Cytochrome c oxidase subunit II n=2 Tax=Paracidobacterium acidisoli TaxID=2303751 RepID=A0A372ILW2_9BACT|nr:cupredoxin domain-containing protein [Paracidobacterium acidisoli]